MRLNVSSKVDKQGGRPAKGIRAHTTVGKLWKEGYVGAPQLPPDDPVCLEGIIAWPRPKGGGRHLFLVTSRHGLSLSSSGLVVFGDSFVVPYDLADDEIQELFGEGRIQVRLLREAAQAGDL